MLYIIKSTLILGILLAVYHLFLEKEKMHRFNRFYLLSGLVLTFATPLITVGSVDPVATTSFITAAPIMITEVQSDIIYETEKGLDWLQFIIYGYGLITLIMFLRFINNVAILLIKVYNNEIINHQGHKVVLLQEATLPHTFLHYIFINQTDFESDDIEDELFIHEFTHADQWHSLDILLIELVHVFYWFNPLVYLYKKAIQLNHEFLADEAVVNSISEVPTYQNLLLDKTSNTNQIYMASNLNFSVTKKRLLMMTKPISKRRNIIYGLMVIPMMIGLVSCFGDYEDMPTKSGTFIDYVTPDEFSVNFTGMTHEDLVGAQKELRTEGIEIAYFGSTFDSESGLVALDFHADFGNDNSITTDLACGENYEPFGISVNRTDKSFCAGFLNSLPKEIPKSIKYFNEIKARYFGLATIVIDNNGSREVYQNFSQLSLKNKMRIPGPDVKNKKEIEPISANTVLFDVSANSIYTRRYKNGKEVPLLSNDSIEPLPF